MSVWLLFAEAPAPKPANQAFLSTELWVTVGLLSAALLIGAFLLRSADRWKKKQLEQEDDSAESLSSFRAMYERGELSEVEYQAIRARIAAKVKSEVATANPSMGRLPSPPPAPSNQASPTSEETFTDPEGESKPPETGNS